MQYFNMFKRLAVAGFLFFAVIGCNKNDAKPEDAKAASSDAQPTNDAADLAADATPTGLAADATATKK